MRNLVLALLVASLSHAAETYVIAAGVESYDDGNISSLSFAVADARAIAEAFTAAGLPERNVTLLTTEQYDRLKRPTKFNILRGLQRYCEKAVGDDTLVFFFAGHGMEKDGGAYLLTADSIREELDQTALPMKTVHSILTGFQAKHVLFLIDACRNDPNKARSEQDATLDDKFARGMRPALSDRPDERVTAALLLACDVGQRAWEIPDEGHGAFTHYLLRGLSGEAGEADGGVKLTALAAYVEREVAAWAQRSRKEQRPTFTNPSGGDFTLPKVPKALPPGWPEYLRSYQPVPGMQYRVSPKDGMPQVLIPAGEFVMGSTAEEQEWAYQEKRKLMGDQAKREWYTGEGPQRRVFVSAFWMDLHEVTNEQYCRFLNGTRPSGAQRQQWLDLKGQESNQDVAKNYLGAQIGQQGAGYAPETGKERHPVIWVTWEGAAAYAQWAGRPLPTEAQWERAARGGRQTKYVWGDSDSPPPGAGNLSDETAAKRYGFTRSAATMFVDYDDGQASTASVGSFAANGFGLLDMAGNVFEWCRDWYDAWYARMPGRDPINTTKGSDRLCRGGSWYYGPVDLRVADRFRYTPDYRDADLGFRCSEAP